MSSVASLPLLLGTTGTDHHPFDRLVGWLDDWSARQPAGRVRCLIQSGTAKPARHAESVPLLPYDELTRLLASAAVVVCHGGPGTIMDCRAAGLRPICVPRVSALGEHVDDHQLLFTRRAAQAGLIELAEDEQTLHRHLDEALLPPARFQVDGGGAGSNAETLARIGRLTSELAGLGPRRRLLPLRWADR